MTDSHSLRPKLRWLVASRWLVLITELAALAMAEWVAGLGLPIFPILLVIGLVASSNVALAWWTRRASAVPQSLLAATIAFDVAALTVELWLSGGPANPFTALYLVYISFAAAVLDSRWTWGLVGLASAGYGVLYLGSVELRLSPADHATQMRVHLQGMWIAFLVAAILIGYSVTYVQRLLTRQRDELQHALVMRERNQRLTALATLAAGAAHELATPLSTIAVVAKEFEHQLRSLSGQEKLVSDACPLRQQVTRCRSVLDRLAVQVSDDDRVDGATIGDVVGWALGDLERADDVKVEIPPSLRERSFPWPPRALAVSLRRVIQNALEASARGTEVSIHAHESSRGIILEIRDGGVGMAPSVLRRATEPFFSTKRTGHGMGLGLFLTQGLMDQLGVNLEVNSQPGRGTTVRFTFPMAEGEA